MKKSELMKLIEDAKKFGTASINVARSVNMPNYYQYKLDYKDGKFTLMETRSGIVFNTTESPETEYEFVTYG